MKRVRLFRSMATRPNGLTLTELVVVLSILVALAAVAAPQLSSTNEKAREIASRSSVVEVRDAVMQFWSDCKYSYPASPIVDQRIELGDLLDLPGSFQAFDPNVGLGWNGPYLQSDGKSYTVDVAGGFTTDYGDPSQFAVRDTFINQDYDGDGVLESGSPLVIQEPTLAALDAQSLTYSVGEPREVRVVSAGPNGILEIDESRFASELESTPSLKGDDIYVSFVLR